MICVWVGVLSHLSGKKVELHVKSGNWELVVEITM